MNKFNCKNCKKNYKALTKKELCCFCFREQNKKWPEEFMGGKKDNHMSFKKNKKKN